MVKSYLLVFTMSKNIPQEGRSKKKNDKNIPTTPKSTPKRKRAGISETVATTDPSPKGKRVKNPIKVEDDPSQEKDIVTKSRSKALQILIEGYNKSQPKSDAIKEIGFGGLLHLKLTSTPKALVLRLLKCFDPKTGTVTISEDKKFVLSKNDVADVFGLPSGPSPLPFLAMGSHVPKNDIKQKWRKDFQAGKGISLTELHKRLKECKESGDQFKRLFVLFTVSTFLAPTSNHSLDMKILKAVDDVSEIKNFDWCGYVFSELLSAFTPPIPKYLRGCVIFLMVAYFHRFDNAANPLSNEFPLIKHWNDDVLWKRVQEETSMDNFGAAPLRKICSPNLQQAAQSMSVKRVMHIELPDNILTDEEIQSQATDEFHALCLQNNRDTMLYYKRYSHRMDLMKSILSKQMDVADKSEATTSASKCELGPTQPFLKSPGFLQYFNFLEEKANYFKTAAIPLPTFEEYCQTRGILQGDNDVVKGEQATMEVSEHLDDMDEVIKKSVEFSSLGLGQASEDQTFVYVNPTLSEKNVVEVQTIEDTSPVKEGVTEECVRLVDDSAGQDNGVEKRHAGEEQVDPNESLFEVNKQGDAKPVVDKATNTEFPHFVVPVVGTVQVSAAVIEGVLKDLPLDGQEDGGDLHSLDEAAKDVVQGCMDSVLDIELPQIVDTSYLLHSEKYAATMSVVPANLGCTINCGEANTSLCLLSEPLIENKVIYDQMRSIRKRVADYCFLHDSTLPLTEQLFSYDESHLLSRENVITMFPKTTIDTVIIDCWALFVNNLNVMHNHNPTKFCFGIHHSEPFGQWFKCDNHEKKVALHAEVYSTFETFLETDKYNRKWNLDVNMVFIPMLTMEHFHCICINFNSRKVEYLDNRSYDTVIDDQTYGLYARALADLTGDFLVKKGIRKGADVTNFELVNVMFDWQVHYSEAGVTDCGVYLMMHMMFYDGHLFECELASKSFRALYRAEMVAALVLSDMNICRSELLRKVEAFEEGKESLLPGLILQRKLEEERRLLAILIGDSEGIPDDSCKTIIANSGESSVLGSRKRPSKNSMSDGLGCTIDCGDECKTLFLVSKYMREHKKPFEDILLLRKEVLDYSFLIDYNLHLGETLVSYGLAQDLSREDLTSLDLDSHMCSALVDHWARLLNELEIEATENVTAFYFGLNDMDELMCSEEDDSESDKQKEILFSAFDDWLSKNVVYNFRADLFFIPLRVDDHYLCVCINFISKKIEVLDNQFHGKADHSSLRQLVVAVRNCMSDYITYKEEIRADDVVDFEVVYINYNGQTTASNDSESGLHMLMNMACYEGNHQYHPNLVLKRPKRIYAAQIVASLILADINECRLDVLRRVAKFEMKKTLLWEDLNARRKSVKDREKKKDPTTKKKTHHKEENAVVENPDEPVVVNPLIALPPESKKTRVKTVAPKRNPPQSKK